MRTWIKKGVDAYLNLKSFKTKKRYLIIESDDWGSLRTKDNNTKEKLNKISKAINQDSYCQLDSIATADDLNSLFDVLGSVHDRNENPACMTANVCAANPIFEKIKDSNYEEFYFNPFTKALDDYSDGQSLFKIWQNGNTENLFKPQLHGREHVHALAWLKELRAGNTDLLKAFELESWGIPYKALIKQRRTNLQAALDNYNYNAESEYHKEWIRDSASIFKSSFGYDSLSFIAPAYTWHSDLHKTLAQTGIKTLQGIKLQYQPKLNLKPSYKRKPHYIGEVDKKSGLIYTNRNAFFEPHIAPDKDWVDISLSGVKKAFDNNNPAILSSHRINYIGRLDEKHRDKNLKMFKTILKKITINYPDVEFIDSSKLAGLLIKKNN
jgi:roadblock/LC7 domain-containing protein